MIQEDYCSYELCEQLKEKGMNKSCFTHYVQKNNNDGTSEAVTTCTLQMAMKWLRKKGYHIEIYANASGYRFIISKTPPDGTDLVCDIEGTNDGGAWDDFSECAESAMKYCLTELMKGGDE